jgi:hypothetical protein
MPARKARSRSGGRTARERSLEGSAEPPKHVGVERSLDADQEAARADVVGRAARNLARQDARAVVVF